MNKFGYDFHNVFHIFTNMHDKDVVETDVGEKKICTHLAEAKWHSEYNHILTRDISLSTSSLLLLLPCNPALVDPDSENCVSSIADPR